MVNDIPDFKKCSKKFDSYLVSLGYKKKVVNFEYQYSLGDFPYSFVIRESSSTIHFRKSLFSLWDMMDFYFERPGSYKPDYKLLTKCAINVLKDFKNISYKNKIKQIKKDFENG